MTRSHKKTYEYPKPDASKRRTLEQLDAETSYQELKEKMDSVYMVIQAYKPEDSEYELTDISGVYYPTWAEAHAELVQIAAQHEAVVEPNEGTFTIPTPIKGLEYDLYYIEELLRG